MSRADDLFNTVIEKGETAINDFIEQRISEELFLDFKRSSDNGEGTKLSQNDRNNYAKAISGFGNSEGGVVVWGVDCSRAANNADIARAKYPISNVHRFKSWLDGAISGCTVPPHIKVRNEIIQAANGQDGFVVSLIPKSNNAPHQVVGKMQYYIRAGSDFVPTPHSVLAGMFGKRPQPNIFHQFLSTVTSLVNNSLKFQIGIMLMNDGPGIATDSFLNFTIFSKPGPKCQIELKPEKSGDWRAQFIFGMQLSMISQNSFKIPPGSRVQPLVIEFSFEPPFDKKLKMQGLVGCDSSPSSKFMIDIEPEIFEELYAKFISKNSKKSLTNNDLYEITNVITGQ